MPTFAYALELPDCPAGRQHEYIQRALGEQGQSAAGEFSDRLESRRLPCHQRPAGAELLETLRAGDMVVVWGMAVVCTSPDGMRATLDALTAKGAALRFLSEQLAVPPTGPEADACRAAIAAARGALFSIRSERICSALRERRGLGKQYTRHAPYGFKWVGPKGSRRLKPIPHEQQVIAKIREWRSHGFTLHAISLHLRQHAVLTPAGKAWSIDRIRRVCKLTPSVSKSLRPN